MRPSDHDIDPLERELQDLFQDTAQRPDALQLQRFRGHLRQLPPRPVGILGLFQLRRWAFPMLAAAVALLLFVAMPPRNSQSTPDITPLALMSPTPAAGQTPQPEWLKELVALNTELESQAAKSSQGNLPTVLTDLLEDDSVSELAAPHLDEEEDEAVWLAVYDEMLDL